MIPPDAGERSPHNLHTENLRNHVIPPDAGDRSPHNLHTENLRNHVTQETGLLIIYTQN